ncbi:hypothetical protein LMG23992_02237 [Cupriavidus laharis]|uniref:Ankyrin repeat domain-containing protein n=1 Tax=Cupriavidus laharis TaxID=151654 RepID=A0ABM8WY08_9BURK|nr:ankyrin repeat domain-containing protein [Cupriavidus laharis]CAG9172451.1 hypothetical protein LMG23992_02237 [Cupriavidus laharis]
MAILPTFESVLLEISQCIGLERPSHTKNKEKFIKLEKRLKSHIDMMKGEIEGIFDALEIGDAARRIALFNLGDWSNFHRFLSDNVWTFDASAQQVVWHMCAFSYAPAAGRILASCTLDEPFDTGMPGGEFWFLPNVDPATQTVSLPLPQVFDWLLDLCGQSIDQLALALNAARTEADPDADAAEKIKRTLYKWRDETIPHAKSIGDYFRDNVILEFQGALELSGELSHEKRLAAALTFIRRKKLDAEALRSQIPMGQPGRIEAVMHGDASIDEQAEFVRLLELRYARPSMGTIRQRLRIARAVQDGYKRLVEFLCPGVAFTCGNANENKVLQLFALFRLSYNATVEAYKSAETEWELDVFFERRLPDLDLETLFLSVTPSRRATAKSEVADLLTHRFAALDAQAPLDDFFALDSADTLRVAQTKALLLKDLVESRKREIALKDRARRSSPWRALQAETDYLAVCQLALSDDASPKARQAAIERMRELAKSPQQVVGAIVCALGNLLNCSPSDRPRDVEMRVEALLDEAESNPGRDTWALPLLQYRAKHCLARNQFKQAVEFFRKAIDCGFQRNFGPLFAEAARDLMATLVADRRLDPVKHERPYRIMLASTIIEGHPRDINIEDVAKEVAEYFWDTLYKPYPGYPKERPIAQAQVEKILGDTSRMIENGDWDSLLHWFDENAKVFRENALDSVRGDSVLLSWLKLLNGLEANMPGMQSMVPAELTDEVRRFAGHLERRRHAIRLLLKAWPEQANITDFKQQSPLILAADRDDVLIVRTLLEAGAAVDQRDFLGRTAVHAVVKGGSPECLTAILACRPNLHIVEDDKGNSALHTALRLGRSDMLPPLVKADPGLLDLANADGLTPLEMGEDILDGWAVFERAMNANQVKIGLHSDYVSCVEYLRRVTTDN